ncbi:hypothetical protein H0I29_07640 [Polaribacter sp. R2A056_3_33]|uniref:hypothetical protein n=1 Tax=Polaribacter sp. R2A056_3_33 TaxID=2745563 RepID=UPI001C4F3997|nr:hypothetical protein [Polaribacter sp. R2A056_3_33]QXP71933.1 hypothetical protein H0I29_07640 [Polaribacter sp. R2A056_3_33]
MKKILLLLTVFSMVFTSCDPLEDIYEEVDANASGVAGDVVLTLTDEDYETLGLSYGSFNSEDEAKEALPGFLSDKYPVWGNRSTALISYDLYVGNAFSVKNYTLSLEDYATSGSTLLGFEVTTTPADYLTDIIAGEYDEANEGDYVSAYYDQYTGSVFTVTPEVSLDENLDYGTVAGNLTTISGGSWVSHSGAPNELMYVTDGLTMADYPSSNVGGALEISTSGSEDVNTAISPELTSNKVYSSALIKLSEVGDGTYFFHLMEEDGSFNFSARTGAKSDGNGKVLFGIGASSSSLTYGTTAYELDTTYLIVTSYEVETGIANLYVLTAVSDVEPTTPEATNTGNSGNSAKRIGIRQGGGGPSAIIDGFRVANTWSSIMSNETLEDETVGDKETYNAIYTFTEGAWVLPSGNGYYSLTDADFASIGIENFGSSTSAGDYLPAFLNLKYPYALEGDVLNVLYKYVSSSSGEQIRGDAYTKTAGVWVAHESTVVASLQLEHDGSNWLPDNTIKYELVDADYTLIKDTYGENPDFAAAVANLDTYGNISTFNWTDEQIDTVINTVINKHFSGMEEDQKFAITVFVYNGSSQNVVYRYILKGDTYIRN